MRYLEPALHLAILLGALLACGQGAPKGDKSEPEDKPAAREPVEKVETPIDVSAATLIADYKANEVRGDSKWKDKLVRVTGIVGSVNKDITDSAYVIIGEEIGDNIHCSLGERQMVRAGNLVKGERHTFTGRVSGLTLLSVMLSDCKIANGPPKDTTPASQPAQAAAPRPQPAAPHHPPPPPAPPRRR